MRETLEKEKQDRLEEQIRMLQNPSAVSLGSASFDDSNHNNDDNESDSNGDKRGSVPNSSGDDTEEISVEELVDCLLEVFIFNAYYSLLFYLSDVITFLPYSLPYLKQGDVLGVEKYLDSLPPEKQTFLRTRVFGIFENKMAQRGIKPVHVSSSIHIYIY